MAVSQGLWRTLENIRCRINVTEFKNYVMPFIFYIAANQKVESLMRDELESDGLTYQEAWNLKDEETGEYIYREDLKQIQLEKFGFIIRPENSCMDIVPSVINNGESFLDRFEEAIEAFNDECDPRFANTLSTVNFSSPTLGTDPDFIEDLMFNRLFMPTLQEVLRIMTSKEVNEAGVDGGGIGQLYMEIMEHFAVKGGKGGGEFFTPLCMSKLVAELATYGKKTAQSIYDPTCGSGSLLIQAANKLVEHNAKDNSIEEEKLKENPQAYFDKKRNLLVGDYYGNEIEAVTCYQAKMNMAINDIKLDKVNIQCCDTLGDPDPSFDDEYEVIVANPPYSISWNNTYRSEDPRFAGYGAYAPAKTADLAFLQHIIYHLSDNGRAAVLLPHGVLFRGNAEKQIRQVLVENYNVIDAIIGLPSNCFYGASIAVACIVLRKDRDTDNKDICFIDASRYFKTANGKNYITEEDIDRIMKAYENHEDIKNFCSIVSLDKISENDFNLNIPLYVEAPKDETEHNLGELFEDYRRLESDAEKLKESINNQLASFGLEQRFTNLVVDNKVEVTA